MSNPTTELVDQLTVQMQDGKIRPAQIARLAELQMDSDDRSRLTTARGSCYLAQGKVAKALTAYKRADQQASSTLAKVEATGLRISIAVEKGHLDLAQGIADTAFPRFADDEVRAFSAFKIALIAAMRGDLDVARAQWEVCAELTRRAVYSIDAKHNLAKIAIHERRLDVARELLEEARGISLKQKGFRASTLARLAARALDFRAAIKLQQKALGFYRLRSTLDQVWATIDLINFLLCAGELEEALETTKTTSMIIFKLRDERENAAAAAITELLTASDSATALISAMQKVRPNLGGLPNPLVSTKGSRRR